MNDIISYSFGNKVRCPKCNAPRIKFQLESSLKLVERLREKILESKICLHTSWNKIKANPNSTKWICKNCFESGVVSE